MSRRRVAGVCAAVITAVTIAVAANAGPPPPAPDLRPAAHTSGLFGAQVGAMAVTDLNHDRRPDVVVGLEGVEPEVAVLLGKPRGGLSRAVALYTLFDPSSIRGGVAVADFNGDRNRDIAWVLVDPAKESAPSPTSIVVAFGDGHGSFGRRTVVRARCCGSGVAAGDFNGDGRRDLAVRGVGVLLGNGRGLFPTTRPGLTADNTVPPSESILPADFNTDGRLDVLLLRRDELNYADDPEIRFGEGRGRFGDAHVVRDAGPVVSAAVGNVNGDRRPDLAVLSDDGTGSQVLRILLGTRTGLPGFAHARLDGRNSSDVALADMNRDGKTDVVVSSGDPVARPDSPGEYWILRGNGRGFVFGPPLHPPRCCDGTRLATGDFNGDRRPDVVTTSSRAEGGKRVQRLALLVNMRAR